MHAVVGSQEPLTRPSSSLSLQKKTLSSILSRVRKKSTPTAPRRTSATPEPLSLAEPDPEVGDQVQVICFSRVRANTNQLYQWGLVRWNKPWNPLNCAQLICARVRKANNMISEVKETLPLLWWLQLTKLWLWKKQDRYRYTMLPNQSDMNYPDLAFQLSHQ